MAIGCIVSQLAAARGFRMTPQISVVMPTHGSRFFTAAVGSVRAQTFGDWELVIVDDDSTDGTAARAARFAHEDPRVRVVTQPRTMGIVAARNRGFAATSSSAHAIAFLDHDDIWLPDALAVLQAALRAHPRATAAHGGAIEIDEDDRPIQSPPEHPPWRRLGIAAGQLVEWPATRPTEFANLAFGDCIVSMGSGLVRRSELVAIGGFDPRAEPADDYDLWIRLARRGAIGFVDRAVLRYRVYAARTSSSRPAPPRGQGTPYVQYKMITASDNTAAQRRAAIAGFRARQRLGVGERLSVLAATWRRGDYRRLPRELFQTVARAAAYARGRPWSWHR